MKTRPVKGRMIPFMGPKAISYRREDIEISRLDPLAFAKVTNLAKENGCNTCSLTMMFTCSSIWVHAVLAQSAGFTQGNVFLHFKSFMHTHCLI